MNRTGLLLVALLSALLTACAVDAGRNDDGESQVLLRTLDHGEISDTQFRAQLARIDGRAVVQGNRRTFELSPGKHTLAFELDVESLHTFERASGRHFPKPSRSAADVREKTLDVELESGKEYRFGALVEDFNYAGWQPFVEEALD